MKLAICYIIAGAAILLLGIAIRTPTEPFTNKFEVIDQYKGCDVVQYSRSSLSTYVYFLHCDQ